jgi:hypothetical protein
MAVKMAFFGENFPFLKKCMHPPLRALHQARLGRSLKHRDEYTS